MKIIYKSFYQQTSQAIAWALLGFVVVFSFFNVLDELKNLGRPSLFQDDVAFNSLTLLKLVLLEVPFLAYDLLPICVLIGTVYAMSRLAVQSEFTVMRNGGFSPLAAIRLTAMLGVVFGALTFFTGDYLAPWADNQKSMIKAQFDTSVSSGRTGGWLKEQRNDQGYAMLNIGKLLASGEMAKVRIFEFDVQGRLLQRLEAKSARLGENSLELQDLKRVQYPQSTDTRGDPHIKEERLESYAWATTIEPKMISSTLLNKKRLGTWDLYQVIHYLRTNDQNSQRQEIDFWSKLFYPISCVVMALMALPFAYLHFRQTGVSLYVFIGIMVGISFFLLSNMFVYIGNLQGWYPWLAAASPSLLYVLLSMTVVTWRVLKW